MIVFLVLDRRVKINNESELNQASIRRESNTSSHHQHLTFCLRTFNNFEHAILPVILLDLTVIKTQEQANFASDNIKTSNNTSEKQHIAITICTKLKQQ